MNTGDATPNSFASIFPDASFADSACPTYAIQLTPDFEMSEYNRQNLVYEKKDLLIDGEGKYPGYNYYKVAGLAVKDKNKGDAENEEQPADSKTLLL
jgi:NADH-quinone oxidoreductase subunit I